jgi:hypothetical protein
MSVPREVTGITTEPGKGVGIGVSVGTDVGRMVGVLVRNSVAVAATAGVMVSVAGTGSMPISRTKEHETV